jgi:hypothetical protein
MISRNLQRLLVVALAAVATALTSGCTAWVGYCMTTYNSTICDKADPEWGAGTDIDFYGSNFRARFNQFGSTQWVVIRDTVTASGDEGHITLKHKRPDFKLQMKYRVEGDARAALAVRAENEAKVIAANAYQITLVPGADGSPAGSVVGLSQPTTQPTTAANKSWGTQEVEVILSGTRLVVSVNGKIITDAVATRTADGYIAVAFHPGMSGTGRLHLLSIRQRSCHPVNPCFKPS